jgi:hypothetical protein
METRLLLIRPSQNRMWAIKSFSAWDGGPEVDSVATIKEELPQSLQLSDPNI